MWKTALHIKISVEIFISELKIHIMYYEPQRIIVDLTVSTTCIFTMKWKLLSFLYPYAKTKLENGNRLQQGNSNGYSN